jgi:hypothetical protein
LIFYFYKTFLLKEIYISIYRKKKTKMDIRTFFNPNGQARVEEEVEQVEELHLPITVADIENLKHKKAMYAFFENMDEEAKKSEKYEDEKYGLSNRRFNIVIDEIKINVMMYIENKKFIVTFFDEYLMDAGYNSYNYRFYFNDSKFNKNAKRAYELFVFEKEEMWDMCDFFITIKDFKYNKIESRFERFDIEKEKIKNEFNETITELFNSFEKCSVCLDIIGDDEKVGCGHGVCKKCCQEMLKRKNKRCPICRKKSLMFVFEKDESDDESDEE